MRRTGDVKRIGVNRRLAAIGLAITVMTVVVLRFLAGAANTPTAVVVAAVLVVGYHCSPDLRQPQEMTSGQVGSRSRGLPGSCET